MVVVWCSLSVRFISESIDRCIVEKDWVYCKYFRLCIQIFIQNVMMDFYCFIAEPIPEVIVLNISERALCCTFLCRTNNLDGIVSKMWKKFYNETTKFFFPLNSRIKLPAIADCWARIQTLARKIPKIKLVKIQNANRRFTNRKFMLASNNASSQKPLQILS